MSATIDATKALETVRDWWKTGIDGEVKNGIFETISEYIRIPNQSPGFDKDVLTNGHQDRAVDLIVNWCNLQKKLIPNLQVEVVREPEMTPVIVCTIPATHGAQGNVLLYGHMDKQPPMLGFWEEGLGPWDPVLRDGKLYGRGGADDGYAAFAALNAIALCEQNNVPHARCVLLVEACEESGSRDLPHYIEKLKDVIQHPSLVVCLDSGCGTYDQLWLTTSLRGMLVADLSVSILKEGVHSGMGSGIVPSTFRILRELLDRVEDSKTGKMPDVCYTDIPETEVKFAHAVAEAVGGAVVGKFPWLEGANPARTAGEQLNAGELLLNATWRPTLSYTGLDGMPPLANAGNVLRPNTTIKLSIRLPPPVEPQAVFKVLEEKLTKDVPYGAHVKLTYDKGQKGWAAPKLAPWLKTSLDNASQLTYGKQWLQIGEGGSIPFMGMLGEKFPETQFVITGVLGPGSNAHGPNEFLHIDMAQRLTVTVALVLQDHAKQH
jgi:acetylornithine deacetylase/succinyl-diaminopimelate desuccinylase-like protein